VDDPDSAYRVQVQIDRRPWRPIAVLVGGVILVTHAILFSAVGIRWGPEGGPEQAALPTGTAPAATPTPAPSPTPLAGVVLRATISPAGQQGATLPAAIPMVAERHDPAGDAESSECDEQGECRTIDLPADAAVLDITHLGAWIDDGVLHAEVRLAGSPPTLPDATASWRVSLSVRRGEHLIDAPVCSGSCGSWFEIPRFTSTVTRGADAWTVAWQIDLDELGDPRTDASEGDTPQAEALEVLGSTSVSSGAGWTSDSTADEPSWAWLTVPGLPTLCPPGSDPDLPGPADQARPPTQLVSMTFDRAARQVVLLGADLDAAGAGPEATETWTFDVCTNLWTRRDGAGAPERALLAYDGDSRTVVAFGSHDWGVEPVYAAIFERARGSWDRRSAAPIHHLLGVVYEPRSGQIVVHGETAESTGPELWAYEVERDLWTRLRQIDAPHLGSDPQHELLAYDPGRARIVLHLLDRSWEYNPASGRWSAEWVSSPSANGGFFGNPGSIATDETSGRVVIYSQGQLLAYNGEAGRWETIDTLEPWPEWPDRPGSRIGQSIVYDSLNRRLVVHGGRQSFSCVDPDDVWAFDLLKGEWMPLLAQTEADLRVSGDGGPATPIPGRSPWIRAEKVTLHGGPFFTRVAGVADEPWSSSPPAAPATVVDGLLLPECQLWTEGTVWWEDATSDPSARPWIEIELGGSFVLDAAVVQADVNDEYRLSYRDAATAEWLPLWDVGLGEAGGMATRPDQGDASVRWPIAPPVVTDALRFEATSGDAQYSVSEIAVFGVPAP
jgi:hypothetical protein